MNTKTTMRSYDDFCLVLQEAGFSLAGGNDSGIYSVLPFDWAQEPPSDSPIRWHTGDPETDPWQWRVRVLAERDDVAYAKLFFGKSGYITRSWYPHFLAVRRGGRSFEDDYDDGQFSRAARRIFQAVSARGELAVHDIKGEAGFGREEASAFSKALVELQARMYITVCGEQPKISASGSANGWMSMVYCPTETFFPGIWDEANGLDYREAYEAIAAQARRLNPNVDARKLKKFIEG